MANEVTKLSNVINPQVMGAMIEAKISALCKLTPYAKVDTTLQGVPGYTKTVPAWNYIGDAQDFDPENMNVLREDYLYRVPFDSAFASLGDFQEICALLK